MQPPPHLMMLASRMQYIHKTPTQLPTYHYASRTRCTPPTPDNASRMQYSHKTRATSPGPDPIVYITRGCDTMYNPTITNTDRGI